MSQARASRFSRSARLWMIAAVTYWDRRRAGTCFKNRSATSIGIDTVIFRVAIIHTTVLLVGRPLISMPCCAKIWYPHPVLRATRQHKENLSEFDKARGKHRSMGGAAAGGDRAGPAAGPQR